MRKPVECQISYNLETERYRFHSEDLNNLFRARETGDRAHAQTASQRIAAQQSFRILVAEPNVVYAEKRFFEPRITLKLPDGSTPILDDVHTVKMLADAKSEKGEGFFSNPTRWRAETLTSQSLTQLLLVTCRSFSVREYAGAAKWRNSKIKVCPGLVGPGTIAKLAKPPYWAAKQ